MALELDENVYDALVVAAARMLDEGKTPLKNQMSILRPVFQRNDQLKSLLTPSGMSTGAPAMQTWKRLRSQLGKTIKKKNQMNLSDQYSVGGAPLSQSEQKKSPPPSPLPSPLTSQLKKQVNLQDTDNSSQNSRRSVVFSDPKKATMVLRKIFGQKSQKFPVLNPRSISQVQQLSNINPTNALSKIAPDLLQPTYMNATPYLYKDFFKNKNYRQKMDQYYVLLRASTGQKNAANFKQLQQYKLAQWDDDTNKWIATNKSLDHRLNRKPIQTFAKNLNVSNVLVQQQLSQEQIKQYVPVLVQNVVASNKNFSKFGFGPISMNSLPFYVGRYIDRTTGNVRVLPKATSKYLNPFSYKAKLSYLQARLLNKWNQFVSAQSQYMKFSSQNQQKWQKGRKQWIKVGAKKFSSVPYNSMRFYSDQIEYFLAGVPVPQTTQIVLGSMDKTQIDDYLKVISKFQLQRAEFDPLGQMKDNNFSLYATQISKICKQTAQRVLKNMPSDDQAQVRKKLKVANAFGTFIDKGFVQSTNYLQKLFRGLLPTQLNEETLQFIEKKRLQLQPKFDKIGPTLNLDTLKKMGQNIGKVKNKDDFQKVIAQFDTSVTGGIDRFRHSFQPKKVKYIKKDYNPYKQFGKNKFDINDL